MYQSITRAIYRSVTVTQSPVRILQNTVPLNVNPLLGIYLTSFPEAKTATPTTHIPESFGAGRISVTLI